MNGLTIDRFREYFEALHKPRIPDEPRTPYSWQSRLAARAVEGDWPGRIDLPTGSGKTACIDIAIFALACQASRPVTERNAPRRIFFCVNRRVIVDEAHDRARKIAKLLMKAEAEDSGVLRDVAEALRRLAGTTEDHDVPPLDVLELRGGIYRDNRWARSATQPTVICTTIDQLGSRLLFRGYGVSPNAAPIQAALIAYDSLILLDEAHISEPFRQSLQYVRSYLDPERWAEQKLGAQPLRLIPMTATPVDGPEQDDVIDLDDEDRKNESLHRRLNAPKWANLRAVPDIAKAAVEEAEHHMNAGPRSIGIIVNRVATARRLYEDIREKHPDSTVELVIGSMRPIDRDQQTERLRPLIGANRPEQTEATSITIATQCLEVGADYDFDVLITECASLDALRQRFGRLNRNGRPIEAKASILIRSKDIKSNDTLSDEKPLDPIYGNALARTWNWLWERAREIASQNDASGEVEAKTRRRKKAAPAPVREIDFGIDAFRELLSATSEDEHIPNELLAPSASRNAPVMLPAYLDFWSQTAPSPEPDPDVAIFLHGQRQSEPDVQVCWRADLEEANRDLWYDIVALLPPTAAECMSVPISRVRRWLSAREAGGDRDAVSSNSSDLLEVSGEEPETDAKSVLSEKVGVLWRGVKERGGNGEKQAGKFNHLIQSPNDLRPGDTLVLPVRSKGWDELGHIPLGLSYEGPEPTESASSSDELQDQPEIDVAEPAFEMARLKVALRLHPSLFRSQLGIAQIKELIDRASNPDDRPNLAELRGLLASAADALSEDQCELKTRVKLLANPEYGLLKEDYPGNRGLVLTTRKRIRDNSLQFLPALDDGDDDASRTSRDQPVTLADHTKHVAGELERALSLLPMSDVAKALERAALIHDWGKADERFQAMLRRTSRTDAYLAPGEASPLLAKDDGMPQTPAQRRDARERAELPTGFRHEMLSVQMAERSNELAEGSPDSNLILHLIAAHHGYGRPFAPVVLDDEPPDVEYGGVSFPANDRRSLPPHSLDSGIAERFWSLTRRFGWWGLAYLEAFLRLADQQASAGEDAEKYKKKNLQRLKETDR
jgi:CRISPR-associated endonuclease/helicase Cas3